MMWSFSNDILIICVHFRPSRTSCLISPHNTTTATVPPPGHVTLESATDTADYILTWHISRNRSPHNPTRFPLVYFSDPRAHEIYYIRRVGATLFDNRSPPLHIFVYYLLYMWPPLSVNIICVKNVLCLLNYGCIIVLF